MYTEIRFSGFNENAEAEQFGQRLNAIVPGLYTGPDRVVGRFSCTVSSEDAWPAHGLAIRKLLSRVQAVIQEARRSGIRVQLDVAVQQEDYHNRWLTEIIFMEADLVEFIGSLKVDLAVTVYGTRQTENREDEETP